MPKVNRKTLIIIGAGVAAVLLVMYLRSRSASASSTAPTDTMGTTDGTGSGYADLGGQVQQSAANEASDVASLQDQLAAQQTQEEGDIAALTSDFQNLPPGPQGQAGAAGAPGAPASRMSVLTPALRAAGAIAAPFGAHAPTSGAPAGYKLKGEGGGNWAWVRGKTNSPKVTHPKTGQTKKGSTAPHTNHNHPAGTAGHSVAQRSHAPARAKPVGARFTPGHPVTSTTKSAPKKPSKPAQNKSKTPKKPGRR